MEIPPVLPVKPLEFSDFSGGITENILQGDPRRYASADNMFITVDKKLEERPGFIIDGADSYLIAGALGKRINGYFLQLNETELLPQVARNIYYKNPTTTAWLPIPGVAGNNTLSGGDVNSQTTVAEFQHQIYLATDGAAGNNGVLPSKIYKNSTNAWVSKTVGLPRAWVAGNYTNESLLLKCIANANALRTSMIDHMTDAKYATFTTPTAYETTSGDLHLNMDLWGLQYFSTQVFAGDPTPSPLPTPAPAATNQATLFTLVAALNNAYVHHVINDAMKNSWGTHPLAISVSDPQVPPVYHQDPPVWAYAAGDSTFPLYKTKGPAAPLNSAATPDELVEAAAMLDDLWQKWNWHRLSVNTHDKLNGFATIDRYAPVGTKIGDIQLTAQSFPTITPDWGDLFAYVNNLRALYNSHVTNARGIGGGGSMLHKQRDNSANNMQLECTLPACTDLDSMYLLIWWIRSLYQLHNYDAAVPYFRTVALTASIGTPNLTAMTFLDTGGATSGIANYFLGANPVQNFTFWTPILNTEYRPAIYLTAKILSSAAGTAVIDRNASVSWGPAAQFQIAASQYHGNYSYAGGVVSDADLYPTTSAETSSASLAVDVRTYGNSIKSWLALANDFFFSFANHTRETQLHGGGGSFPSIVAGEYLNFIATAPNAPFFIPSISQVAYGMLFSDKYTVETNGIEYLVQGNPVFSASKEVPISYPVGLEIPNVLYPDFYPAKPAVTQRGTTLTRLPVLANDASTNYDTANIKLNLYRTTDGGNTFFTLAELANGTTSYLDIINDTVANPGDTALNTRKPIYTSGGVVGFDQPPICKYTHILNGYVYWGAVTDSGQFFPNRIRQSIQYAPDAAPATFTDDLDDEIVGISSARNNALAFCKSTIYRMGGAFNTLGQGALTHDNISDTLGALNAKSIVKTEIGVFFAGTDGFYYTDGYQVIPLTLELKKTYAALTMSAEQRRAIYGGYDKITRRVWWSMREGSTNSENSVVYTFYLEYGIKPSGTFTLIRNGLNFQPSSLVFKNGVAYIGDGRGFLLKMDQDTKWDVAIDPTLSASSWNHIYIPYDFASIAVDMGSIFNRKWLTKTHLVGKNTGNMAIQPYLIRDVNEYNQGAVPLAPVNYTQNVVWGTPNCTWGDSLSVWKTDGKMDVWRRFPARSLRSDFMQIQFKPADLCVYASSVLYPDFSWATVALNTPSPNIATVTLLQATGYTDVRFPTDVVGYRMKFVFDGYLTEYTILSIDATQKILTVSDPNSSLVSAVAPGMEWEIWGIKKEQRFSITSFVVHFAYLGDKNQKYPGPNSNDGAGNAGQNP